MEKKLKCLLSLLTVIVGIYIIIGCSKDNDDDSGDSSKFIENLLGVRAVDLGLPSGTKWANRNVGATDEDVYGQYFAWGEIVPFSSDENNGKKYYSWNTYKWCEGTNKTLTKYNLSQSYGNVDNKSILEKEDDAAAVLWGGNWRTPTVGEFQELLDNTVSEWKKVDGVLGRQFKSRINGDSIFLPASGWIGTNGSIGLINEYGDYWTSTLKGLKSDKSNVMYFNSIVVQNSKEGTRCYGYCIRPVYRTY